MPAEQSKQAVAIPCPATHLRTSSVISTSSCAASCDGHGVLGLTHVRCLTGKGLLSFQDAK